MNTSCGISFLMVPVFCLGIVHAQIPDNHVVATAGNTYADPSIQLDWTLGEVAIQSFEAGTSFVTLGIHQPDYNFVSAISPISESGYFLTYPNPVADDQRIHLKLLNRQDGKLLLYTIEGKPILSERFNIDDEEIDFNMEGVPAGTYTCIISTTSNRICQSIQIIKIK